MTVVALGRSFLAVQRLGLRAGWAGSTGSVPAQGTKIPRAVRGGQTEQGEESQQRKALKQCLSLAYLKLT